MTSHAVLEAFGRELAREVHNLARWPGALWQQLYNRLRWEEEAAEVLSAAPERTAPWARIRTRYAESQALLRTMSGHDFWVSACAVAPGGDTAASAEIGSPLVLWDLASGAPKATLEAGGAAAFSPDGSRIACARNGSDDGMAVILDARTGAELAASRTVKGLTVDACAFGPDGSLIATGHRTPYSTGGAVIVWDAATLQEVLPGDGDWPEFSPVTAVNFTPDGRSLVAADYRAVRTFDLRSGGVVWANTRDDLGVGEVHACAVAPDGRLVATGGTGSGQVSLIEAASGAIVRRLGGEARKVYCCAFSPDGEVIALGTAGGAIELWDVDSGERRGVLAGHANDVLCCSFSPDGALLVSGSRDLTMKVWNPDLATDPTDALTHRGEVSACVASPDGSYFMSGGEDGILAVWDAHTGERTRSLPEAGGRAGTESLQIHTQGDASFAGGLPLPDMTDLAVSADGSLGFCVSSSRNLRTWNIRTGEQIATWRVSMPPSDDPLLQEVTGHEFPLYGCDISPDQAFMISSGSDRAVRIWDLRTVEEVRVHKGSSTLHGCAVSPDGVFIVAVGLRGAVEVWEPASDDVSYASAPSGRFRAPGLRRCAVAPDATYFVAVGDAGAVGVWDSTSKELRLTPRGHDGEVHDCAVTPDGKLIVTGGDDHTIRLWDASDAAEVMVLPVPGPVRALAVHPWLPALIWGDSGGQVFTAELSGIEYGALATVPYHHEDKLVARCVACRRLFAIKQAGVTFRCPGEGCGATIRVSERIRRPLDWRPSKREARKMKKEEPPPKQSGILGRMRKWSGGD